MIGIGLMGFLLAGVTLLLSTTNLLERGQWSARELIHGPQLVFESRTIVPAADDNRAVISRSNPNHPVILTGFPAYQGVTFNLPVDARPTSGHLQIDATLQVLAGVEGILRISIDNVRRGEMLLRSGEMGRSLQVPLSPTDLARTQLVVSFSLQGASPNAQCPSDLGYAAIVEIEATSAIYLTLERPLTTARDQINAWGYMARIDWPRWLNAQERARRFILATQFKQRGIEAVFIDVHSSGALTTLDLRQALSAMGASKTAESPHAWPYAVALTGANAGLRRFYRTTRWRITIDLRNGDAMRMLDVLDLHLALGFQANGSQWAISVTLNGRLLHQDLLDPTQTRVDEIIALPPDMQTATNVIEVTATATHAPEGLCNNGPELIAEMLPKTKLSAGASTYSDGLTQLRATLSDIGTFSVGGLSKLTAADADAASRMLAQIVPLDVTLKPAEHSAQIIPVVPNDAGFTLPDKTPIWLISRDATTQRLVLQNLEGARELSRTSVSLLIIPGAMDLSEVKL